MFSLWGGIKRDNFSGPRNMVTADEDKQNADEEECNVHVCFPRFKPQNAFKRVTPHLRHNLTGAGRDEHIFKKESTFKSVSLKRP